MSVMDCLNMNDFDALKILESAAEYLWQTSRYYPSKYPSRETDPDSYDALQILRDASVRMWRENGVTL